MKPALLWITFAAAVLGGIYGSCSSVVAVMDRLKEIPDVSIRNMLGFTLLLSMFPAIFAGVYLGDIVWLLVWRFFATREEMLPVVTAGPTTKFDRWLFRKLVPPTAQHAAGALGDGRVK